MSAEAGRPRQVDKFEKEARLLATEELLVSGIGSARVERELARRFGVSVRQVRRYIADVRQRWSAESKRDSAFRREKLIRMAERLYAKAYAADRYGPANSALQTLARIGGAFASDPGDRIRNIETILGPAPTGDPLKAMEYAQGVLLLSTRPGEIDEILSEERNVILVLALTGLNMLYGRYVLLPLIGGLYVVEAASVIIQVASFKLTGKRIFRMAPIHHHFEQLGWKESTIVIRFWIIAVILALIGLATLKLR